MSLSTIKCPECNANYLDHWSEFRQQQDNFALHYTAHRVFHVFRCPCGFHGSCQTDLPLSAEDAYYEERRERLGQLELCPIKECTGKGFRAATGKEVYCSEKDCALRTEGMILGVWQTIDRREGNV